MFWPLWQLEEWRARLSGIAQGGGGSYFDASNATQLVDALQQAIALTYRVRDAQGVAWVKLRLPQKPNNVTGWVRRSALGPFRLVHTRLVIGDST